MYVFVLMLRLPFCVINEVVVTRWEPPRGCSINHTHVTLVATTIHVSTNA